MIYAHSSRRISSILFIAALSVGSLAAPMLAQPAAAPTSQPASKPATPPEDRKRTDAQDPAKPDAKYLVNGDMQPRFAAKHKEFLERAKQGPVDLLFLGDSITEGWTTKAPDVFKEHFGKYATANFGISGDRTQHVLWRIDHGELDTIKPKLVVLMIGTNNFNLSSDDIARGVTANVQAIRAKLPAAKILLLAIFPRGTQPNDPLRIKLNDANQTLAKLDDGQHVFYQDIASAFLEPDGTLPKSIFPDQLHPNREGYVKWADAIQAKVDELMK